MDPPPPHLLIKTKCTEPYYTSPVLHIDKYGHSAVEPDYITYISHMAECRCTDLVSLSLLLSLSTPKRPPENWAQVNTALLYLVFYCHHFQLLSLCNWPSSGVCPLYNIPSLGVKGTSSVLWSSANFCCISQNMHYKAPVASQHWKTNKVVWTWKDDWPPRRTSTYERPLPERVTI